MAQPGGIVLNDATATEATRERRPWGHQAVALPTGTHASFLRIADRTWHPVQWEEVGGTRKALLLPGWIVRQPATTSGSLYSVVANASLQPIPEATIETLLSKYPLPRKDLALLRDGHYVYLDVGHTWFPSRVYRELVRYSPQRQTLLADDGSMQFWQFPILAWPKVDAALRSFGLHATLQDESSWQESRKTHAVEDRPARIVSNFLDDAYSEYLKRESRINFLRTDLALSAEVPLQSFKLRTLWEQLDKLTPTSSAAAQAQDFIRNYSHEEIDWKWFSDHGLDPTISGIVLTVELQHFGRRPTSNYYRLYVPDLETVLHLNTTIDPQTGDPSIADPAACFLQSIQLARWRAYPYLGRIRNTGTGETIQLQPVNEVDRSVLLLHLAGLPSIEYAIAQRGLYQNFNADRVQWSSGHHPFTRTFLGTYQVVRPLDRNHGKPNVLVRDCLGFEHHLNFQYEDYGRRRGFLRGIRRGDWIEVLSSSTLQHHGTLDPHRSPLEAQPYHRIETVSASRASQVAALGVVRAFGTISHESLSLLGSAWTPDADLSAALRLLTQTTFIHDDGVNAHYLPVGVKRVDLERFIQLGRAETIWGYEAYKAGAQYNRLGVLQRNRAKGSPLDVSAIREQEAASYLPLARIPSLLRTIQTEENRRLSRVQSTRDVMGLPNRNSDGRPVAASAAMAQPDLLRKAYGVLKHEGAVRLRAAGQQIPRIYDAATYLRHELAYLRPEVQVASRWLNSPNYRETREVTLRVTILENHA